MIGLKQRLNEECVKYIISYYSQHRVRGKPPIYIRLIGRKFYECFWQSGYYVMWMSTMFRLKHDKDSFYRPVQIIQSEVRSLLKMGLLTSLELHAVYDIADSMDALKKWLTKLQINGSVNLILSGHFYFFYTFLKDELIDKHWNLNYLKLKFDALSEQTMMMDHYINFYPHAFRMCDSLGVKEIRLYFMNTRFDLLQKTITEVKAKTVFMEMACGSSFFDLGKYITHPDENNHIEEYILDLKEYHGNPASFIRYALDSLKGLKHMVVIRSGITSRKNQKPKIELDYSYSDEYHNVNFLFVTIVEDQLTDQQYPVELPLKARERYILRHALSYPKKFQFVKMTSNSLQLTVNMD